MDADGLMYSLPTIGGREGPRVQPATAVAGPHCLSVHRNNRALDKERLEGAADQTAGAARASSAGAAPADDAAAAAAAASAAAAAAAPAAAPSSLPAIFRTRPSARFGAPKPRPLYAKAELLLNLMYQRLYWDPTQPESSFSVDALLRAVRKTDKEMGP